MNLRSLLIVIPVVVIINTGCNEVNNDNDAELAKIRFLLTDMPGDYQEVNIDLQSVKIKMNDTLILLNTNQGVYNLLDLVNGEDTIIVNDEIPGGFISQIRLILGENNSVMVDSVIHDMKTPSAQQSGLKLNVQEEIVPGISYTYVIDFDAMKSIVKTGNGKFILKPVIKVFTEALSGSIEGTVAPPEARPGLLAILDDDTVRTNADTVSGHFMIRGLAEGNYSVEVHPLEGFRDTTLSDIPVLPGQVTSLDTLFLN